jgi:hypothetical protein
MFATLKRWPVLLLAMGTMAAAQMHPPMGAPQAGPKMPGGTAVECPWLTRGTAATVLGGDVSLAVAMVGHDQWSCMFRGLQNLDDELTITVSGVAPPTCRKNGVKLVGVANWATACSISRSHHRYIETVSGQARDTYFTVTLSFREKKKWHAEGAAAEQIAEMVAGSLY